MAKKNKQALGKINYKVKARSKAALATLAISFYYNESRKGVSTISQLLGTTKGKTPVIAKDSMDLLEAINTRGFEDIELVVTTPLGSTGAPERDIKRHQTEEANRTEQMSALPIFPRGGVKGVFSYKGEEVELTQEDVHAEWVRTFPLNTGSGKSAKPRVRKESEVVISGNRRLTLLILHNALARKAGHEGDVVTHITRECRVYDAVRDRKNDSILLNERGKQGKLESTKQQKLGASFDLIEGGGTQADLRAVFAGNRGVVQINYEICADLRIMSFADKVVVDGEEVSGKDAYSAFKDYLLSPGATLPNQGRLSLMRPLRMKATHDNGTTEAFATAGPGKRKAFGEWTEHKLSGLAAVKKNVKDHPELAQGICDLFLQMRDGEWKPDREGPAPTSSMASATLQAVAAKCDDGTEEGKLLEQVLNVSAGADNSAELADVTSALMARIEELKGFLCYLRDSKGDITGEPIHQGQLDAIVDKAKTSSGRRRKA